MSTKKSSIEEILSQMNFSDEEKSIFMKSIEYTKLEQADDEIDAKEEIYRCVKELIKDEI